MRGPGPGVVERPAAASGYGSRCEGGGKGRLWLGEKRPPRDGADGATLAAQRRRMNPGNATKSRAFSLWDLRRYLRPYTPALAPAGSLMAARAVLLLVTPSPLKLTIDSVIFHNTVP